MRASIRTSLAIGIVSLLLSSPELGQTAASIEYQFTSRPSDLSDDFQPTSGTDLKFLSLKAIDGNKIDGALWQAQQKAVSDTTIIVMIHGSGGSYRRSPESALGGRLAAKGYAALAIDTRQHHGHINTENFFDVPRDIDAAVWPRSSRGRLEG